MKRLMTILLTLLVMGCGKEAQMQTISIGFSGITSGQMTKEVAQSGVSELISSTFPTSGITFTLTSTTQSTRVYSVGLGEEVTVPIDEYKVTASFKPQEKGKTFKNGSIYAQPKFSVNETINVTNLQSEYEVTAIYGCWALVIDSSETKKYQHMGYSYSMEDFTYFVYSGDLGIAFISGTWTTDPYKILAAAKERYNDEDSGRILIPKNPFRGFRFRITANGQKPLPVELMQKVILAESDDWRVRTALDIFVVSFCLMGANMADLWDATPVDGVWKYNRHKVEDRREDGAPIECVIPPEVRPYAERLGGRGHWLDLRRLAKDSDHCGQFVVRHLSKWCESQGVPRFTLYAARHTWATLARKCGVELATVDQSLGHVGEFKVANIYAERNWELSHEANRRVLALFKWGKVKNFSQKCEKSL